MKTPRCVVWKEHGDIAFNFFDNHGKTEKLSKKEFYNFLEKELPHFKGKIVVNGGHFIPSINSNEVGKNPTETWEFACSLSKWFLDKGYDSYVSLIINDLPFTPEERKKLSYLLPKTYADIVKKFGVKLMTYSGVQQYAEKKLANKFSSQSKSNKWNVYGEEITNLCVQAIIAYSRDIKKQGAGVSIWITPKCTHKNLIDGLKIFDDKEGDLRNILYFETDNCFL